MNEGSEIRKGGNAWWIVAGVVLGLVVMPFVVLYLWGMFLPDDYEVTVSGTVAVPPETLFQTVADPESQAVWALEIEGP